MERKQMSIYCQFNKTNTKQAQVPFLILIVQAPFLYLWAPEIIIKVDPESLHAYGQGIQRTDESGSGR